MSVKLYAKADIKPTEDLQKVIKAISNVIAYDEIEIGSDYICACGSLETIKNLARELKERKIRGAARKIMLRGLNGSKICFSISKQAALAGTLNLVEDDLCPLGEIDIKIVAKDAGKIVDCMAPSLNSS